MAKPLQFTVSGETFARWNVSNVEEMDLMFVKASFNQDLSTWGDKNPLKK